MSGRQARLSGLIGLLAAQTALACTPLRDMPPLAADDFRHGLARWRLEAERPPTQVRARDGVLDLQTPAGLTLWWHQPLQGDYLLRFTALALPAPAGAGPLAGRLSDLNMFWNAAEPGTPPDAAGPAPAPRSGALADHDRMRLYYVGFGANGNLSTRLRRYDGEGGRAQLDGWADPPVAGPADRQGAMTAATRLHAGLPLRVEILSRAPTAADPVHLRWSANGQVLFTQAAAPGQPAPLRAGWFALRTTASRLQVRDFEVLPCH